MILSGRNNKNQLLFWIMKQSASLDTSFWINCHRVGILDKIFEYFDLHVCEEVKQEILSPLLRLGIFAQDAII
ncbi:MAG: hypothetical protein QG641_1621, partial [Candidatus Poribacteria bacterium]|nr:hypothetical protein [Candidatus Poribacteria bacterium]